jgi:hypothetical protein
VTGKVAKFKFDSEDELFDKLAEELDSQIADTRGLGSIASPLRDYEAIELVHSRLEVALSDGAFKKLGGGNKTLIAPRPGETLPAALRREIDSYA